MVALATSIETEMTVSTEKAFMGVMTIDLSSIFTGYGPLPAVRGVKEQVGGWDAVGQTRTVMLSDGSTAKERLDKCESPQYFSYTVSGFTGSLRFLTSYANGEWWFASGDVHRTKVKWRYVFNSRNVFVIPVLYLITNVLWKGYMKKAMQLSKQRIEASFA